MTNRKYITTTLPYLNSVPHIGHCFEFVLADVIASYYKTIYGSDSVFLNIGVDEHGQKIAQKAKDEWFESIQDYCDKYAEIWKNFCEDFHIDYSNFYRTTSEKHKSNVVKFFEEIKKDTYKKQYSGKYCVGCEAFITEKEIEYPNNCSIHGTTLVSLEEENVFFDLKKYAPFIKDTLVDKSLSNELSNILQNDFDLSITRKNVDWGVKSPDGDTFYVWFDALLNYIFSIGYYDQRDVFDEYWNNSLQICGQDNLKFQSFIFQALLIAAGIPQTKEVLVHGMILDERGKKMSKTIGNVIDPIEQKNKFGLLPLRYYLIFGLNTYKSSKYSEKDLADLWNADVVNGLGNTVARVLHLVDTKNVNLDVNLLSIEFRVKLANVISHGHRFFHDYDFNAVRLLLNNTIGEINQRINDEKPFDKNCVEYDIILRELYFQLKTIVPFYQIIFKEKSTELSEAFINNKKVILFERIKI
jgi:methionyl-tRNA synthetase